MGKRKQAKRQPRQLEGKIFEYTKKKSLLQSVNTEAHNDNVIFNSSLKQAIDYRKVRHETDLTCSNCQNLCTSCS